MKFISLENYKEVTTDKIIVSCTSENNFCFLHKVPGNPDFDRDWIWNAPELYGGIFGRKEGSSLEERIKEVLDSNRYSIIEFENATEFLEYFYKPKENKEYKHLLAQKMLVESVLMKIAEQDVKVEDLIEPLFSLSECLKQDIIKSIQK